MFAACALGVLCVIALTVGFLRHRNYAPAQDPPAPGAEAGVALITLDPEAFAGEARETYRIARKDPALLAKLYCYCHCDVRLGHRNLLDCYRDSHASECGICMGEARDAEQMAKQGSSIQEIRDSLRSRYQGQE